jgi:hypothetical protein
MTSSSTAGLQLGVQTDLHAAGLQLGGRAPRESLIHRRQDSIGRLDQHPVQVMGRDRRIVAAGAAGEVLELGERFDPRVAGADEHERQGATAYFGVVGGLDPGEHLVAEMDRLAERPKADRVLDETGYREQPVGAVDGVRTRSSDEGEAMAVRLRVRSGPIVSSGAASWRTDVWPISPRCRGSRDPRRSARRRSEQGLLPVVLEATRCIIT